MIISISGRAGSGKDLCGRIIQELVSSNGKKSDSDIWINVSNNNSKGPENCVFEIHKFASYLKQIVCLLTGCTMEQLESQKFKESLLPDVWKKTYWEIYDEQNNLLDRCYYKEDLETLISYWDDIMIAPVMFKKVEEHLTYRELLQKLGTDICRTYFFDGIWENALLCNYSTDKNWIVTDTRFPNELAAIKAKGGVTIKIVRPLFIENSETGKIFPVKVYKKEHYSETALDNAEFDFIVQNDSSVLNLISNLRSILIILKIIK